MSQTESVAGTLDYKKAISVLDGLWLSPFHNPAFTKDKTLCQIEKIEAEFLRCESFELEFKIGSALKSFTFFFIRGDERKTYLERVVRHWEKAYDLARGESGKLLNDNKEEPALFVRACLGSLLIEEAQVRNLERGLAYLEPSYKGTKDYKPVLCTYAEGLYKKR